MRVPWTLLFLSATLVFVVPVRAQTSLQANLFPLLDGHPGVMLKNTYTADARAYIVECDYPGPNGETLLWIVSHDGIGGPPYTVWAGKSEQIGCPLNTISAEVKAVAYDDGKTEGDPQFIAKIAAERVIEAQEVAEAIPLLQNAVPSLSGSSSAQTMSQLAQQFIQCGQQHANNTISPIARDWVCTAIARRLSSPIHNQPISALVQAYISELQKFSAALPKPGQTPAPSTSN